MTYAREKFGAEELAICLSHYDLGIINSIKEFPRGSRRSPKVVIDSGRGQFLFKRRARGREELEKVAFTHQIQLSLAAQNFPLPHLVGTRPDNNSMLVWNGGIYEMFEYIEGHGYSGSLEATASAGKVLGLYHKLLMDFQDDYKPPPGSYHNAGAIHQALRNTIGSLPLQGRPSMDVLNLTIDRLEDVYRTSARKVQEIGLDSWQRQIVHGDWHPGNMLFRDNRVVAVIDYDTARLQQRVIDVANGVLQFSIIGGSKDPLKWPDQVDLRRFKMFLGGYDSVNVLSVAELNCVPYLMCEALIAEAVLPIAATGSFGQMQGWPFLQMIDRKVAWILKHIDHLRQVVDA